MSDPYRTPGKVETFDEKTKRLRSMVEYYGLINANGRTADELAKLRTGYELATRRLREHLASR